MMCHLSVKASCHKLHKVFNRLNGPVRDLFSKTSFGYLLDLPNQCGDELLIYGLLLHMLRPTAETDAIERLYFRFSRRTLSFGSKEFCLVTGVYMRRCPKSRIEFSTMYKHGYGENTIRSRVFPYRTNTSLVVEDLELLILNQRFNDISAQDGVRAILLYILTHGFLEKELNDKVTKEYLRVVENLNQWNRFLWGSYLWSKTYPKLSGMFKKFEDHMSNHPTKAIVHTILGFVIPLKSTERTHTVEINKNTAREIMAILESLEEEIGGLKKKRGTRDGDDLEQFFNDVFEGNEDVIYSPQKSNRINEDAHVGNPQEYDSRKQIAKEKKKKKKEVVASDIADAENHILKPVVKEGRPVRQLKPSQYLSSPYVSVQNATRYRTGGVIPNEQPPPPPVFVSDPSALLLEPYVNPGCNAHALYMGNKPAIFLKHRLYNEKMEARFWDRLFYASDMGFLDEAWAGSATGNPFDPLDGCKYLLEVDRVYFPICINPHHWVLGELWMDTLPLNLYDSFRLFGAVKIIDFVRFEELMDRILVKIEYWNHMGLPVQKASITVTDVTDVPQQEGMYGECGVFMLMFMEQLVSGRPIGISMALVVAATQFRYRMAMIYYGSSIQSILSQFKLYVFSDIQCVLFDDDYLTKFPLIIKLK
ncbi:unnamed protein product [Lactuca saligna]|uniref:Ubiquitin-like protease family profile domain-containing protein n=1 Tax=Lactuca saligna TaxID=75948 RepID=A0AA35VCR0_LACSI|nr:unnamed protein product [Lactuca saligna]